MNTSKSSWSIVEAPEGKAFLCEFVALLDLKVPDGPRNIVPPPLLVRAYAANAAREIYLPRPAAYGAYTYRESERTFVPFALPLPSMLIKADCISIRPVPCPPCLKWPPYTWPFLANVLALVSNGSLSSRVAEVTHTPAITPN